MMLIYRNYEDITEVEGMNDLPSTVLSKVFKVVVKLLSDSVKTKIAFELPLETKHIPESPSPSEDDSD
jgi:hypothetical protein